MEANKYIDNIELDGANNLILQIRDELSWEEGLGAPDEKKHLTILQDKLNACLLYIQSRAYKEKYPDVEIKYAILEVRFKYMYSEHCKRYLQLVHNQLTEYGIKLDIYVDKK